MCIITCTSLPEMIGWSRDGRKGIVAVRTHSEGWIWDLYTWCLEYLEDSSKNEISYWIFTFVFRPICLSGLLNL